MANLLQSGDASTARPADARVSAARLLSCVSVIVPIGPGESAWRGLLPSFSDLASDAELVLVAAQPAPPDFDRLLAGWGIVCNVRWIQSTPGRASQLNVGARLATREFAWFLHADCRFDRGALVRLESLLDVNGNALHYFDLAYEHDGPHLTWLNAWGAYFRSRLLGLPFGDQGFCLRRDTFYQLGSFDEAVPYGEDHLLVWAAHRSHVPVRSVSATITTSARKYATDGWPRTTARHFWRTWRQGLPQWIRLHWGR